MRKRKLKYIEMPPDRPLSQEPTNRDRAAWAGTSIKLFAQNTSLSGRGEDLQFDPHSAVVDLLCDMAHWCQYNRVDFGACLLSAVETHLKEESPAAYKKLVGLHFGDSEESKPNICPHGVDRSVQFCKPCAGKR